MFAYAPFMRAWQLTLAFSIGAAHVAGACGHDANPAQDAVAVDASTIVDGPATPCTPGQALSCTGAGGCSGVQVCQGNGNGYNACACETATFPAWRQGMAPWQWKEIPTTSLSAVTPPQNTGGGLYGRLDAWNGVAADERSLYLAASGGHADYAGNEVYQMDLNVDAPTWIILRQPTPANQIMLDVAHYADGRPTSSHNYYNLHFVRSLNRVFRFGVGSAWGSGNHNVGNTDAFAVANNDWDPANTYGMTNEGQYARAVCLDPRNEHVFATGNTRLRRFDPATKAWTDAATWPDNGSAVYYTPCAVDPVRNRVLFFGDVYQTNAGGLAYDITNNAFTKITFTGNTAGVIGSHAAMAYYEPALSSFVVKTATHGDLYNIDPVTLAVAPLATSNGAAVPNAVNGVYTKFVYVPRLKGYAYTPGTSSNVWFLALP